MGWYVGMASIHVRAWPLFLKNMVEFAEYEKESKILEFNIFAFIFSNVIHETFQMVDSLLNIDS